VKEILFDPNVSDLEDDGEDDPEESILQHKRDFFDEQAENILGDWKWKRLCRNS